MVRAFYLRHAESTANRGPYTVNAELSSDGQVQALGLSGHFNYILCSPLTRCLKTLELSKITYDHLSIVHKLREKGDAISPAFQVLETADDFELRIRRFEKEFRVLCNTLRAEDTVLIVGHGLFYSQLMGKGFLELYNAEMVELPCDKYQ